MIYIDHICRLEMRHRTQNEDKHNTNTYIYVQNVVDIYYCHLHVLSVLLFFLVFGVVFSVLYVFVLYLVYLMLLVSLDCQFLIVPSVFCSIQ